MLPYEHSMSLVAFVKIDRSTEPQITACTPTVVTYADVDYFYETALSETITAHAVSVHPQQLVLSHFIFSYSLPQLPWLWEVEQIKFARFLSDMLSLFSRFATKI